MLEVDWGEFLEAEREWRGPRPTELLFDARDFHEKAKAAGRREVRARYARASVLLSVASIEAITNDALLTIYGLLADTWPSECVNEEPWVYFGRVSPRPIERMLARNASLGRKKIPYIFRHLRRLSIVWDHELDALEARVGEAIKARNRIVHMTYLLSPKKHRVVLNPAQITHLGARSVETAKDYIDAIGYTFEEVNLPVATISGISSNPSWWSHDT